ncbi:MAG TPA: hypothetical protein VGF99_11400 [Myxococcota bacterium]
MTRIGGGGGGGGGGHAGGGGAPAPKTVDAKSLDADVQRALELMRALADLGDIAGRKKILEAAGAREPLTPRSLGAIAALYARLDMPLDPRGIARFKAERALVSGNTIAGPLAKAYVRALDGGEVLFRIDRTEEQELRPGERACLNFLRVWARGIGAEPMGRLKDVLGLGNPPVSKEAQPLMNEYVGVTTVKEIARVTAQKGVPLTNDGLKKMVEAMEAEKAGVAAKEAAVADKLAAKTADKTLKPMTATSMPVPRAKPSTSGPKTALDKSTLPRFPR